MENIGIEQADRINSVGSQQMSNDDESSTFPRPDIPIADPDDVGDNSGEEEEEENAEIKDFHVTSLEKELSENEHIVCKFENERDQLRDKVDRHDSQMKDVQLKNLFLVNKVTDLEAKVDFAVQNDENLQSKLANAINRIESLEKQSKKERDQHDSEMKAVRVQNLSLLNKVADLEAKVDFAVQNDENLQSKLANAINRIEELTVEPDALKRNRIKYEPFENDKITELTTKLQQQITELTTKLQQQITTELTTKLQQKEEICDRLKLEEEEEQQLEVHDVPSQYNKNMKQKMDKAKTEKKTDRKVVHDNMQACVEYIRATFKIAREKKMPRAEAYDVYEKHCKDKKVVEVCPSVFGKCLRQVFPDLKSTRKSVNGKQVNHYTDIAVRRGYAG